MRTLRLLELRVRLAADRRYADHETVAVLMLVGPHEELFGQTQRRQLDSPRQQTTHLDTFAGHAGSTSFGATIYQA